jgi:hypothetical protein
VDKPDLDWKDSSSLEDWLFAQFEMKRSKSPEVQAIKRVIGARKMKEFWERWLKLKKEGK